MSSTFVPRSQAINQWCGFALLIMPHLKAVLIGIKIDSNYPIE